MTRNRQEDKQKEEGANIKSTFSISPFTARFNRLAASAVEYKGEIIKKRFDLHETSSLTESSTTAAGIIEFLTRQIR